MEPIMTNNLKDAENHIALFERGLRALPQHYQKVVGLELMAASKNSDFLRRGFNTWAGERLGMTPEGIRQLRHRIGRRLRSAHKNGWW